MIERYLERIGLDQSDLSLEALQLAHVRSIPYENLDIHLGRDIRLDVDSLTAKMVDHRRGGYCYEQNTLFAAVLESLGFSVTRYLGRVRLSDAVSPRPATHMALLVDGRLVDVGFGAANPLGPVPLGGEATYGPYTWRTERTVSPEGEDAWMVRLFDMPLYTFTEAPQHPVDYVAPNHFSSTHPLSIFTQATILQRWERGDVQVGLVGLDLTVRRPDGGVEVTRVEPGDLGSVLRDRFLLDLDDDEVAQLVLVNAGLPG
ncbi:MAG: arylamine N-acetyltransferase family protein [Actinomycetota bacterium]